MANAYRGRAWAIAIAIAATACGGSTFENLGGDGGPSGDGGGGGGDSGSGGDGSGGAQVCPVNAPSAGASCSPDGLECEYGNNPQPDCNVLAQCSAGKWAIHGQSTCPPPTGCPTSYSGVPVSQRCTPEGEACAYPQGTCYCTRNSGGPVSTDPRWVCVPTPSGCPSTRPDIGSPCTHPGLSCDYGACSGGAAEQCKDGYWQRVLTPCPV